VGRIGGYMNKILSVLLFMSSLLLYVPAFGQQVVTNSVVGITWKQPLQPGVTGWNVLASKIQGTGYVPVSSVMYDSSSGIDIAWRDPRFPDFAVKEFRGAFTIPDAMIVQGRLERFYFVMTASITDRGSSIFSNEIYFDVDLGLRPPTGLRLVP
jgi:hypothetical protein